MTIWTHCPHSLILSFTFPHFPFPKEYVIPEADEGGNQNLYLGYRSLLQSELSSQFWRMKEAKYRDL